MTADFGGVLQGDDFSKNRFLTVRNLFLKGAKESRKFLLSVIETSSVRI